MEEKHKIRKISSVDQLKWFATHDSDNIGLIFVLHFIVLAGLMYFYSDLYKKLISENNTKLNDGNL